MSTVEEVTAAVTRCETTWAKLDSAYRQSPRSKREKHVGAFQLEVSVDQDLSVIVAEAIDDDVVKQRLVPIAFTRA